MVKRYSIFLLLICSYGVVCAGGNLAHVLEDERMQWAALAERLQDTQLRTYREPVALLCHFEECMRTATRLIPRTIGLKKNELIPLWHALNDIPVPHGLETVLQDCDLPGDAQESVALRAAITNASVICTFSVHALCAEQRKRLCPACVQPLPQGNMRGHLAAQEVRDNHELERFRSSALAMRQMVVLSETLQKNIPTIATMSRGELTKQLYMCLMAPSDE